MKIHLWTLTSLGADLYPFFATLTTREKEALKLLAEDNSVKEIAYNLKLSLKTVEVCR